MSEKFTTPGAIVLKHSMPTEAAKKNFDIYSPLDKNKVGDLVTMLLRDGGPEATDHINNLAKIFFNKATEIGSTTPLSDYINDSDERQAIIQEFDHKVRQVMQSNDHKSVKNDKLAVLATDYGKKIEKQNLDYLLSKGSTAAKMAKTKARGNPTQLATGTSTPLMSSNVKGELIPVVIKRSFAEGMRPAEHIALSYMGRSSTVSAQMSTSLPGALFKRLSPTMFHEVVTIPNCYTRNGIMITVEDKKSLVGRYEADTDKLITETYLRDKISEGVKSIKAKSPSTCEAKDGICQHCFGLMANGKLPEIGTNVGVIAAQSVSEKLTQSMLSTKHKTTVGERRGNSYEQAANILNNPDKNFKDEATISNLNGVVSDIKKSALGDSIVYVNEVGHFVPRQQNVLVEKGTQVRAGDKLSTGTINPRKLVSLRGIGAGREYMAKELREIYSGDGKIYKPDSLDPRHFEIIAKNLLKYVEVVDPGHTGLLPGDKVDVNTIRKYLDKGVKELPVDQAEGSVLARGVSSLVPGTLLDTNHIQDLKDQGFTKVHITPSGLKVRPIVPGLQTAKMLDKNWISKLSFSKLRDSLKDSAATMAQTDIHSTDPIASYMMGNEFGEGTEGKY